MHAEEVEVGTAYLEHLLADALDEGLGGAVYGIVEDLLRRAVLVDIAALHEEDARRYVVGELHLVGDDEHRQALLGQLADDAEHLAHHRRVEGTGRLVEEDDVGLHGQGAGDGHTLFLAAGEARRIDVSLLDQPHLAQQGHSLLACRFLRLVAQLTGGEDDVLQDGLVLEEVERLEHHAHLLAQAVDGIASGKDVLAIDDDAAAGGRVEQVEGTQEGALARARWADDGDDLAPADICGDVAQHVEAAVTLLQVRDM